MARRPPWSASPSSMAAPCASAICLTMARPRPLPSARGAGKAVEAVEDAGALFRRGCRGRVSLDLQRLPRRRLRALRRRRGRRRACSGRRCRARLRASVWSAPRLALTRRDRCGPAAPRRPSPRRAARCSAATPAASRSRPTWSKLPAAASGSRRAMVSSCSTRRAARCAPARRHSPPRAPLPASGRARTSSSCSCSAVSGVRSSCAASAVKRFWVSIASLQPPEERVQLAHHRRHLLGQAGRSAAARATKAGARRRIAPRDLARAGAGPAPTSSQMSTPNSGIAAPDRYEDAQRHRRGAVAGAGSPARRPGSSRSRRAQREDAPVLRRRALTVSKPPRRCGSTARLAR